MVYISTLWYPPKIVSIIKLLCGDFRTNIICGQYLTEYFEIKTGVKQGCILSPFLFCLGIDWIMKETALGDKGGIKWTFTETLDDLEFADDISLLSHRQKSHRQKRYVICKFRSSNVSVKVHLMPPLSPSAVSFMTGDILRKSDELAISAGKIGLKINTNKTKTLQNNSQTADPITIGGMDIEEVTEFTYLVAKVSTYENSESEIKARIRKARGAFAALTNIWKTNKISNRTRIRLFKSNVLSVLLYATESWKVTKGICQNKCLRTILRIYRPNKIEMDRTRLHNAADIHFKGGHALNQRARERGGDPRRRGGDQ